MDPLASVFPRRQGERYDWRIYPLALSGAFSNTATRLASFIVKGGSNVYGSYPDIDELFPLQAAELDPKKPPASRNTATAVAISSTESASSGCAEGAAPQAGQK